MYYLTSGKGGTPIDMPIVKRLLELNDAWSKTGDRETRKKIWHEMLAIHADKTFSIGLVGNVPQPVVMNNALKNVPANGIHNWDPGAHFGLYKPDTFWFDR
jgi:peptide/nickel transport system substrate-binding protein